MYTTVFTKWCCCCSYCAVTPIVLTFNMVLSKMRSRGGWNQVIWGFERRADRTNFLRKNEADETHKLCGRKTTRREKTSAGLLSYHCTVRSTQRTSVHRISVLIPHSVVTGCETEKNKTITNGAIVVTIRDVESWRLEFTPSCYSRAMRAIPFRRPPPWPSLPSRGLVFFFARSLHFSRRTLMHKMKRFFFISRGRRHGGQQWEKGQCRLSLTRAAYCIRILWFFSGSSGFRRYISRWRPTTDFEKKLKFATRRTIPKPIFSKSRKIFVQKKYTRYK